MAKSVAVGSTWYVVSFNWIEKWQQWVGYDKEKTDREPGEIDNSDLIDEYMRQPNGSILSTSLPE